MNERIQESKLNQLKALGWDTTDVFQFLKEQSTLVNSQNQLIQLKNLGWDTADMLQFLKEVSHLINGEKKSSDTAEIKHTQEQKINIFLLEMGFRPNLEGFDYLQEAIAYCIKNGIMAKGLYPEIAQKHDTEPHRVEETIRQSIQKAYKNANPELIALTKPIIDSAKGRPKSIPFISFITEEIRTGLLERYFSEGVFIRQGIKINELKKLGWVTADMLQLLKELCDLTNSRIQVTQLKDLGWDTTDMLQLLEELCNLLNTSEKGFATRETEHTLKQKITILLIRLGFKPNIKGFVYLEEAISYCVRNGIIAKGLYPKIAQMHNANHLTVRNDISYSIRKAFAKPNPKLIAFTESIISDAKNIPVSTHFIALVAKNFRTDLL